MTNIGTLFYLLWFLGPSFNSFNNNYVNYLPSINEGIVKCDTISPPGINSNLNDQGNDKKLIVVLDAGHGGKDHGCSGKNSHEKEITLALSLKIRTYLEEISSDIQVVLTREKDRFIPLHERIQIANREHSELFISIHANSFHDGAISGYELYVNGLHEDEEGRLVAERENASIYYEDNYNGHYRGFDPESVEAQIIYAMHQNIFLEKSIYLAQLMSNEMKSNSPQRNRGVRQAGFVVLREAEMPSVLIEAGFLTSLKDESYLQSDDGQNLIAQAIGDAILTYLIESEEDSEKIALTQSTNY